ncbi:hypothetical protein B0H15DRAFT_464641 [Mycena belliarum]|uniref:Uncharacterized protein n=1 Tax=Mycena belliarum TaxID=1033014 RepID=A0AAD6UF09_9AGAR|nr:hypothetical protein B0H15DRAFT_464641 [Mycena belliae]
MIPALRALRAASESAARLPLRRAPACAAITVGLEPRLSFIATSSLPRATSMRGLSTSRPRLFAPATPKTPPPAPKKRDRFEELGITKPVKIFLFAVFTVLASVETWLWTKALLRWYYGAPPEVPDQEAAAEDS